MLTTLGLPILRWLDETVLPEASNVIAQAQGKVIDLADYVVAWREALEDW